MNEDKYKEILVSNSEESYGSSYKKDVLELYKSYLEMTDRISSRRQSANSFFLTINSAIIGLVSYVNLGNNASGLYWVIGIAGILICFTWYRLIRSYKDMNTGKFLVIHEIEKLLPLAIYDSEWEVLGRGNDPKKYLPFTNVELTVPLIFAGIHFFVIIFSIQWCNMIRYLSGQ